MGFNGSGVFSRLFSWVAERDAGNNISSSDMDAETDGIAEALSNMICRDGQSTVIDAIPFNNQKITGLGDAEADQDALNRRTADDRYPQKEAAEIDQYDLLASSVSASDIDCTAGNFFYKTVSGALTWTFSDPPAAPRAYGFVLELNNGGVGVQTWPASVDWPGGVAPELTVSGVDVLVFITRNGGTIWRGVACMQDSH